MTYQPVVPTSGLAGWRFLQATLERQTEAFENSNVIKSDRAYFSEKIGSISNAEELVADRRLLSVALGAFGLEDDINNKYFITKVLEEGTTADDALANKLSDTRYKAFSEAFGFGWIPQTSEAGFADKITDLYETRSFEVAVGEQNETFRFGLNLERELPEIAASDSTVNSKWYSVMGNSALKEVFQTAFGLPAEFGSVDLDQQLEVFKDYAQRRFGTSEVDQFAEPEKMEELLQLYFLQEQIAQTSASSASVALTLLQSANGG